MVIRGHKGGWTWRGMAVEAGLPEWLFASGGGWFPAWPCNSFSSSWVSGAVAIGMRWAKIEADGPAGKMRKQRSGQEP